MEQWRTLVMRKKHPKSIAKYLLLLPPPSSSFLLLPPSSFLLLDYGSTGVNRRIKAELDILMGAAWISRA
jgi:hypothetical protein